MTRGGADQAQPLGSLTLSLLLGGVAQWHRLRAKR